MYRAFYYWSYDMVGSLFGRYYLPEDEIFPYSLVLSSSATDVGPSLSPRKRSTGASYAREKALPGSCAVLELENMLTFDRLYDKFQ